MPSTPIARATQILRVRVTCELTFAGVTGDRALSHAEAISRLELAAKEAGAAVEVQRVTSEMARCYPALGASGPPGV